MGVPRKNGKNYPAKPLRLHLEQARFRFLFVRVPFLLFLLGPPG